jgi:hypothetical protein
MGKKRLTREQKIQQTVIEIINEMFKIAGHNVTYDDVQGRQDEWYNDWTMTEEQTTEWRNWGEKHLVKTLKMTRLAAYREMAMINLMWGLKTK